MVRIKELKALQSVSKYEKCCIYVSHLSSATFNSLKLKY